MTDQNSHKTEVVVRIKNTMEAVKALLVSDEKYRNSDCKLLARIWANQLQEKGKDINTMTAHDLLSMLGRGEIALPYSIERCRRKIQEENPILRGDRYVERKQQAKGVKKRIKDI